MNPETVARARAAARRLAFRGHVPTGSQPGVRTSSLPGPGSSFGGYREYQYGDDLRLLDWNVFARSGRPHVKVFQQDRAAAFLFVVDMSRSMLSPDPAKWEAAGEAVCTLAAVAGADDEAVGYVVASDQVEAKERPRRGARQIGLFMDLLSGLAPGGSGAAMTEALETASQYLRRPAVLVVASDCLASTDASPRWIERLRALRLHQVIALVVTSPSDAVLPDVGLARMQDAETAAWHWVDTSAAHVRQAFAQRATLRRRQTLQRLAGVGATPVEIWTDRPIVPQLSGLLRSRGV
jgi:uncharacterized protein (DUF58 family)